MAVRLLTMTRPPKDMHLAFFILHFSFPAEVLMPELPEVETIKRGLEKQAVGKTFAKVDIRLARVVRQHKSIHEVKERLQARTITGVKRRGKFILFCLDSSDVLVLHLGMTGQLLFSTPKRPFDIDKYTHVIFHFADVGNLFFRDVRQFGQVFVADRDKLETELGLGPEPLSPEFTEEVMRCVLNHTTKIKPLLLDQTKIAGIGNIYSDEALHRARIHPLRPASSLTKKEATQLYTAIQEVLNEGIRFRGTSVDSFTDSLGRKGTMQHRHRIYRKDGTPCCKCGATIQRIKIAGRSSYFCPKCQK